jgi:dienelactone hydrolase
MRRAHAVLLGLLALALAGGGAAWRYVPAAALVAREAEPGGLTGRLAAAVAQPVTIADAVIPWRGGTLSGRWYRPDRPTSPRVLLVPGVHAAGIDEPRLGRFARDLAAAGHPVLTAGLPDLEHYTITPRSTDMIEDAARYLAGQGGPEHIGLVGISFAGGLAIVAAGRPSLRDRVGYVVALGGHGDLPRTLRYLVTGVQPDGARRPPHDYGLAIVLLGLVPRVVPPNQADALRQAILTYLDASILDLVDKARSAAEFARARSLAAALAEPSHTLMAELNARDVSALGPRLLPYLSGLDMPAALSPERSPPPLCPVYLLHGSGDNVVPAVESRLLAGHLAAAGVRVRLLVTPLITHAELDRETAPADVWRLIRFWSAVLHE